MLTHRSVLLWAIIVYAACNALWTGFAAAGIWQLAPAATMGDIRPERTALVSLQNGLAAMLWAALAVLAYRRSRKALWVALALIPLKILGWTQAAIASGTLPDLPVGMIAIWAAYRVSMVLLLALVAAYLWRLARKERLA